MAERPKSAGVVSLRGARDPRDDGLAKYKSDREEAMRRAEMKREAIHNPLPTPQYRTPMRAPPVAKGGGSTTTITHLRGSVSTSSLPGPFRGQQQQHRRPRSAAGAAWPAGPASGGGDADMLAVLRPSKSGSPQPRLDGELEATHRVVSTAQHQLHPNSNHIEQDTNPGRRDEL